MAWDNAVVTNGGLPLLQQVLEGKQLYLDGAAGGTGTVSPSALMAQTALRNQKQTFPIMGATNVDNGKKVNIQITNLDLTTGYPMQQVGIWAHVDTGPSVLFAIIQDSTGLPIPSETELPEFAMNFYAVIDFSNDAEFSVIIDPTALVTASTMNEAVATRQKLITASGLLNADGTGNITAAIPGTDYGYPLRTGISNPTTATVGIIGQHYFNKNTGREFVCIRVDGDIYTWKLDGASDASDITYSGQSLDTFLKSLSATQIAYLNAALPSIATVKDMLDSLQLNKASLDTFNKVVPEQISRRVVDVTASKTLALSDAGTLQRSTGSSAITIVIPSNADVALPIGTEIEIFQHGAGRVTLDFSTSGVSLLGTAILTLPLFQYRATLIRKIATNQWALDISFLRKPVVTSSSTGVSGGYTLALTDAGTIRYFTGTTTVPIIIPTNSSVPFPIGTEITFIRVATSKCTFAADSGVTLISTKTGRNMDVQGSIVELKKWDTNSWVISGDLVP